MSEQRQGIIVKAVSGFYYVKCEQKEYECKARGIFRKKGTPPLVGDTAVISISGDTGIIEELLPRKNLLSRPPIANLDRLYIVSSFSSPAPNTLIIDKLTALARRQRIEPVIVFNKSDMGDFSDYEEIYRKAGFRVFTVSCLTGDGVDALTADFAGNICALTGNSGVGKSSLLNRIIPDLSIKTGEISEKLGRGRHTTRHVELYNYHGGYIADTPGFSSIEFPPIDKEELAVYFEDFSKYTGNCRFVSCSHTGEKGCAVIDAVNSGEIAKSRLDSYISMYRDAEQIKKWELKK